MIAAKNIPSHNILEFIIILVLYGRNNYDIRMKGDVNDNGVIEVADIQREINIILEVPPPATDYESWAGDCDGNASINISDVQLTINRFLGL